MDTGLTVSHLELYLGHRWSRHDRINLWLVHLRPVVVVMAGVERRRLKYEKKGVCSRREGRMVEVVRKH